MAKRIVSKKPARFLNPLPSSETLPYSEYLFTQFDIEARRVYALAEIVEKLTVNGGEANLISPILMPIAERLYELVQDMRRELKGETSE